MFCNKCGNKMEDNELFCRQCGTPRKGEAPAASAQAGSAPVAARDGTAANDGSKRKNTIIAVAAGVLAVAVLSAVAFVAVPSGRYKKAVTMFGNQQYIEAFATLQKLSLDYKDVMDLYGYYDAYSDYQSGLYESAADKFERCGSYRDAVQMITECRYSQAVSLLTPEGSAQAREMFLALGDYKDSQGRLVDCDYFDAVKLLNDKNYKEARAAFNKLGGYRDSEDMLLECDYMEASDWLYNKETEKARAVFLRLGDYKDSVEMLMECDYVEASVLLDGGSYKASHDAFVELGDYKDSAMLAERSRQVGYEDAISLLGEKFYAKAANVFHWLGDYGDSASQFDSLRPYWYRANSYKIAVTKDVVYGLKSDGTVMTNSYNSPVSGWRDIVALAGFSDYMGGHIVGLKADGTVVAHGNNRDGQCDVSSWRNIVEIAALAEGTVGLKSDGTVVLAGGGYNSYYNLENKLSSWNGIVAIAAQSMGGSEAPLVVGLKADGSVVAVSEYDEYDYDLSSWSDIATVWASQAGNIYGVKRDGSILVAWKMGDELRSGEITSDDEKIKAISGMMLLKNDGSLYDIIGEQIVLYIQNDGRIVTIHYETAQVLRELDSDESAKFLKELGVDLSDLCDFIAINAVGNDIVAVKADGSVVLIDSWDEHVRVLEGWVIDW